MGKINESLYSIDMRLSAIIDEIVENGGEITDELAQELEINEDNLKEKLDSYRKVIAELSSRIDYCKKEKTRIDVLSKSRQRIIDRLSNNVLNAVLKFGNENKSGNKIIELPDAKLMSRKNKVCEVNTPFVLDLISVFKDRLRELWNNDMIDNTELDIDGIISVINQEFNADRDDESKIIITKDDLESTKVNISFNITLADLLKSINNDIVNTYFNHEDLNAELSLESSTSDYKNYITNKNVKLNCAEICDSYTLNIK